MLYCFSDKYDEIKIVYQSATTTVTLISSKKNDELFLMKSIHKNVASSPTNFLEADLLKDLHHPSIPQIFDTYEDDKIFAFVEEYMIGDTLDQYLLYHQPISQDTFLQFALQLCDIFIYLHTHKPYPILYLDLKPNHIIVCGMQLKIIDFGNAIILSSSGNTFQKFGTKKYAAPEQKKGQELLEQTDQYGVGKMLLFMLNSGILRHRLQFLPVIKKMTRYNPYKRYESMQEVKDKILTKAEGKKKEEQRHLNKEIAVVGSCKHAGCTHVAIALVCYLNQMGLHAYYKNKTKQSVVEEILRHDKQCIHKDGLIYHEYFRSQFDYGPAIKNDKLPEGIQVVDYGCVQEEPDAGATIYVCSGTLWHEEKELPTWTKNKKVVLVANHFTRKKAKGFARQQGMKLYFYPAQADAFSLTIAVKFLFFIILKRIQLL